jgi:SAM-dependent methyltransferase
MNDYFSYCQTRQLCDPSIAKLFMDRFNRIGLGNSSKLLEIGAGSGRLARTGCLPMSCVGVDTNPPSDGQIIKANATALPFAKDCFDGVVSLAVFDVIWDLDAALREMSRVLQPGGSIVHVMDLRPTPLSLFANDNTRAELYGRRAVPLFDKCISGRWLSGLGVLKQGFESGLPALSVAAAFVDGCDVSIEVDSEVLKVLQSPSPSTEIMALPEEDLKQVEFTLGFMEMFRQRLRHAARRCGLRIEEDAIVDSLQNQLGVAGEFGPGYVRTIRLADNQLGVIAHRAHVAVMMKV